MAQKYFESVLPDAQELSARVQAGETMTSIAKEYGVSRAAVSFRIRNAGFDPIGDKFAAIDSDEVVRRYKEGSSVAQIAEDMGVSEHHAYRIVKESGIEIRPKYFGIIRDRQLDSAPFVELYERGVSVRGIADQLGHQVHTVRKILKREGVYDSGRDRKFLDEAERERLIQMVLEGKTQREISKELDVSHIGVRYWIKKRGLIKREDGTWALPEDRAA